MNKDIPNLSIVIICKNEEKNIRQSIESAINASRETKNAEVILVDSCSEDDTVSNAKNYPITILQLRSYWRHTPAAGRHIGYLHSRAEHIMFLDGDSILNPSFPAIAIGYFEKFPRAAAVVGMRREIYSLGDTIVGEEVDINHVGNEVHAVHTAPGSAIYRRSALDKAGCFNPYIYSEEEAELGERLGRAGFTILAVPHPMVTHHTPPRDRVSSFIIRLRSNFLLGLGQVIRYRCTTGSIPWTLLKKATRPLQFSGWLVVGIAAAIASFLTHSWSLLGVWALATCILTLLFSIKAKSIRKPMTYSMLWLVQAAFLVRGFLIRPTPPDSYPTDYLILRQ